MLSLGKPVFVLVKKKDEENQRKGLPSDIVWKMRVVPYEGFIDIMEGLSQQLQYCPQVEPSPSVAEEAKEVFAEADPRIARTIDRELKKLKREQEEKYERLEELFKQAILSEPIRREKEIEISPSLENGLRGYMRN